MNSDSYIDIDWFGQDLVGNIVHFASGGGRIPLLVKNTNNDLLVTYFHGLPANSLDVDYGPKLSQFILLTGNELNDYLRDFREMSRRGLFSFDKSNLGDRLDNKYHLVSSPKVPLINEQLPEAIRAQLIKLDFNANKVGQVDLSVLL